MAETVRSNNNPPVAPSARPVTYADVDMVVEPATGRLHRISWGAVVAGMVLGVVIQMTLYLLGVTVGAVTVNPLTEQDPLAGLGTGLVIWDAASTLIALFAGGWVAGRLAGIPSQADGAIHGLVVWAMSVIVSVLIFSTALGSFLNSTANLLGQSAEAAAALVGAVAPEVTETVETAADAIGLGIDPAVVREQVLSAVSADTDIEIDVTDDEAFTQALADFAIAATQEDGLTPNDREALQDGIANSTTLTETEIEQVVAAVESNVNDFAAEVEQTAEQVQQQAAVIAENAAETIAAIAGILFASLIVGVFAAGMGGFVGAPQLTAEMEALR